MKQKQNQNIKNQQHRGWGLHYLPGDFREARQAVGVQVLLQVLLLLRRLQALP